MLTQILSGGQREQANNNNNKNAGTNGIHIPTPLVSRPEIVKEQAAIEIQRVFRGHKTRKYDSAIKSIVNNNKSPPTRRVIDDPLGIGNMSRSSSNLSDFSNENNDKPKLTEEEEEIEIKRRVTFGTQEDMQNAQENASKPSKKSQDDSDEEGKRIKERIRSYSVSARSKVTQIRRKSEIFSSKKSKVDKKTASDAEPEAQNDNNTTTTKIVITETTTVTQETTSTPSPTPKPKKERHSMFVKTQQLGIWIKKKVTVPGSKKPDDFDARASTQSNPT